MSDTWFNGAPAKDTIPLPADDRGLLLGDGLFETIAVFNRTALYLESHIARMAAAAAELAITLDTAKLRAGAAHVLANSGINHGILRLTATRSNNTLVTLRPRVTPSLRQPVALIVSSIRRNETAPSSRHKTTSYADSVAATREAQKRGADDAVMLNTAGNVASTSISNLFILTGQKLATPSLDQGILPGIVRRRVLDMAAGLGYAVEERPVAVEELANAGVVFLTNSLRFVRICTTLEGERLKRGSVDDIFDGLCDEAQKICGFDPRAADFE